MFDRFTEKAFKSITLAQEEARRLGHNFVSTEMVLVGLISEGTSLAAKTLISMGVTLKDARAEVEKIIGRGTGFVGVEIPFTPRTKRVLELSDKESKRLAQDYIGPEHLLLGLIREGKSPALKILEKSGVNLSKLENEIIKAIKEAGNSSQNNYGTNYTDTVPKHNTNEAAAKEKVSNRLPIEIKELAELFNGLVQRKEDAIRNQDIATAVKYRDAEQDLKEKISNILIKWRKDNNNIL